MVQMMSNGSPPFLRIEESEWISIYSSEKIHEQTFSDKMTLCAQTDFIDAI